MKEQLIDAHDDTDRNYLHCILNQTFYIADTEVYIQAVLGVVQVGIESFRGLVLCPFSVSCELMLILMVNIGFWICICLCFGLTIYL